MSTWKYRNGRYDGFRTSEEILTANTQTEAEAKRAKFPQAIDDSYRGGEPCRVTVQRKEA